MRQQPCLKFKMTMMMMMMSIWSCNICIQKYSHFFIWIQTC